MKFIKYLRAVIFSSAQKEVEKQNIRLERELNQLRQLEQERLSQKRKPLK